jgi:hypothetical protein
MFCKSEILKLTILIRIILWVDNAEDMERALFIGIEKVRQLSEVFGVHFYAVEISLGEVIYFG